MDSELKLIESTESMTSRKHEYSIGEAMKEFLGVATVGFLMMFSLGMLTYIKGHPGEDAVESMHEFFKHAISINLKIIAIVGIFSAPVITFQGHTVANSLRDFVIKPSLGFLIHTCALAIGCLLSFLLLKWMGVESIPQAAYPEIWGAIGIFLSLFLESFAAYLCAAGVAKRLFEGTHDNVFALAGAIVFVASVAQLVLLKA